jgi:hypothetical protein
MMTHTYNPSTWESESEGSRISGQLGLNSEFEDILGYISTPCLKKKKPTKSIVYITPQLTRFFSASQGNSIQGWETPKKSKQG